MLLNGIVLVLYLNCSRKAVFITRSIAVDIVIWDDACYSHAPCDSQPCSIRMKCVHACMQLKYITIYYTRTNCSSYKVFVRTVA